MAQVNLSLQISQLSDKGLTVDEIAGILEVSRDDVLEAIAKFNDNHLDIDEMLKDYRPRALKRLMSLCEDRTIENQGICVAAGKAILDFGEKTSNFEDEILMKKLSQMRERVNEALRKNNIINITPEEKEDVKLLENATA